MPAVKNSICFQAAAALDRLKELDKQPKPPDDLRILSSKDGQTRMRMDDIQTEVSLFQPRGGINADHVAALKKAKQTARELDPVLVLQVGPKTVLLDGHHRLEVYKNAQAKNPKKEVTIPVQFFEGSLEEALDEAGGENTKARLPMTTQERQDYAWRRTVLDLGSIAHVARVAGVSERTVTTMRQVRKKLSTGEGLPKKVKPEAYGSWKEAWRASQGEAQGASFDYDEAMDRKAKEIAEQLHKKYGSAFTRSPKMTARVLEIMFQERLGEVQQALRELVDEEDEEDEDDNDVMEAQEETQF